MFIKSLLPFALAGLAAASAISLPATSNTKLSSRALALADEARVIPFPFQEADLPQLEDLLSTIENIPDSVIDKGTKAVAGYLKVHGPVVTAAGPSDVATRGATTELEERANWIAIAKCVYEVLKVIAEAEIPLARLKELKNLIKGLKGAKAVAKALLKARSLAELGQIAPELKRIAVILSGAQGVVNSCFGWM